MNGDLIYKELLFKAVRSSGAGGQHVNKVSSKILLTFDISNSIGLSEGEKNRLLYKLKNKLNSEGCLLLSCSTTRSQHKNKELVVTRFFEILEQSLKVQKKRKPTKVPKAVIKKRLDNKRRLSDKKANRKKPPLD